jgi:Rha family phage regulatory protein
MTVPVLNFQDFIAADGDQLLTTSQQVAAVFGKRHDHVLDKVRALMRELPEEFNAPNFRAVVYQDAKGESRVSYQMTRDGFTLLAMSFTGGKALAFKVAYINAFNAMAAYIKNQREGLQFDYLRKELEFKTRKGKISACAREMRHWQDEKPKRIGQMTALLEQMQPSLLSH